MTKIKLNSSTQSVLLADLWDIEEMIEMEELEEALKALKKLISKVVNKK